MLINEKSINKKFVINNSTSGALLAPSSKSNQDETVTLYKYETHVFIVEPVFNTTSNPTLDTIFLRLIEEQTHEKKG
jgi:hypothetical protein